MNQQSKIVFGVLLALCLIMMLAFLVPIVLMFTIQTGIALGRHL